MQIFSDELVPFGGVASGNGIPGRRAATGLKLLPMIQRFEVLFLTHPSVLVGMSGGSHDTKQTFHINHAEFGHFTHPTLFETASGTQSSLCRHEAGNVVECKPRVV